MSLNWRNVTLPILVAGVAGPSLAGCGGVPGASNLPGAPGNCPDIASAAAIAQVDWKSEFGFEAEGALKIKSALTASVELQGIAAEIEAELKGACTNLANDLGASIEGDSAEAACKAAAKAIGDMKAKAGGSFKLAIVPPTCSASMDAMADCAASCDANIEPGSAEVTCEGGEISGSCAAECSGSCEMSAGATCEGTCEGSCEAGFKGTCNGNCEGKCDGKNSSGECAGTCEGKCEGGAKGQCTGTCKGKCELSAAAKCDGSCSGSCSVEMEAPKCSGELKPPEMSADCSAECDAKVSGKLECTPASVSLVARGAADADAAMKLKAALEANLPVVLKVAIGMKDKVVKVAGNVKAVAEGGIDAAKGMAKGGATAAAKVGMCLAAPFTGAIDAAANIQANVDVSVNVQASASAEGSASAGG
ncbi:MAG: hypothetical protein CSA75_03000 [Sorangium cellulosum]|nr:MAG: hypothetical protein CSA75_03000 [Sorangium cellulosum]